MDQKINPQYELYTLNRLPRPTPFMPEQADENALCEALPFLFRPNCLLALHAGGDKKGSGPGYPTDDPYSRWLIKLTPPHHVGHPIIAVISRQWQLSLWYYKDDAKSGGLFPASVTLGGLKNKPDVTTGDNIILLEEEIKAEYRRDTFELMHFEQADNQKHTVYLSLFTHRAEHFLRLDFSGFTADTPQVSYFLARLDTPIDAKETLARQIGGWDGNTSFFFSWGEMQPLYQNAPKDKISSTAIQLPDNLKTARLLAAAEQENTLVVGGSFDAIWLRTQPLKAFKEISMLGLVRCLTVIPMPNNEGLGVIGNQEEISPLILAGCDDYRLYVLDQQGKELGNIFLGGVIDSILVLKNHSPEWIDLAIVVRAGGVYCARLFYDQLKFDSPVVDNGHPKLRDVFIERVEVLSESSQWLEIQLNQPTLKRQILGLLTLLHQPTKENLNTFQNFLPKLDINAAYWLIHLAHRRYLALQDEQDGSDIVELLSSMKDAQCHIQIALRRYADWLQVLESEFAPASELAHILKLSNELKNSHENTQETQPVFEKLVGLSSLARFRHLIPGTVYSPAWVKQHNKLEKSFADLGRISAILLLPAKYHESQSHTVLLGIRGKLNLHAFSCSPSDTALPQSMNTGWSQTIDTSRIRTILADPLHPDHVLIVTHSQIGWVTYNQAINWHTEQLPFKSVWTAAFSLDGKYLVIAGEWHSTPEYPAPLYVLQRKTIECKHPEKGGKRRQHSDEWTPLPTKGLLPPQNRLRVRITTLAWAKAGEQRDLWATAGGRGEIIYWQDAQAVLGAQTQRKAQIAGIAGTVQTALVILHLAEQGEYLAVCGGEDGVVRAFDKHGRLRWLNVLPGSIRGITVRSQHPLDAHDPYAPLAVLCDKEHLFLFDEKGLQRGILHLPHWTLSCLARADIGGKAYHLIGDLTGKVLLVKELPKGQDQTILVLCGQDAQNAFEKYYTEYAKLPHLWAYCEPDYAKFHPLQAAWAAQELIKRGEFNPVIALLEAVKTQFDTSTRTLRPLIFHALGQSISSLTTHTNLISIIEAVRDGALASFISATPRDSNANKANKILANRIFVIARNKALKEQQPFTMQALLELIRIKPESYTRRVENILIEIIKEPQTHQNTTFLEGLFAVFFSSLALSEVGILAALADIPTNYPKLNAQLKDPVFSAKFITLLDKVSWSVFSSQEAAAWRLKKALLFGSNETVDMFQADAFEATLLQIQNKLRSKKYNSVGGDLIAQFLSLLPNITMPIFSTKETPPLLWQSYIAWTEKLRQLFRDSYLLETAIAQKELQEAIDELNELKLDIKYESVLLHKFTLLWKKSWIDACREKQQELAQANSRDFQLPSQIPIPAKIITHICAILEKAGFENGKFYQLCKVRTQDDMVWVLNIHLKEMKEGIAVSKEDYQTYFSQYHFTGGYPKHLYWETHQHPKIDNGSFWYKHKLAQDAHLELPYLVSSQDGYRAGGFFVSDIKPETTEKPGIFAGLKKHFLFQNTEELDEQTQQTLLEQLYLLTESFKQQENDYNQHLKELEQLLTRRYSVDEQLVKEAQQTIVVIALKLSDADGAILWQPEPKDARFLEAVAYASANPMQDYTKYYKGRRFWVDKAANLISVQAWQTGATQFKPVWNEQEKRQYLSNEDPKSGYYQLLSKLNSVVSLPVKFADNVLAVLTLHSYQAYAFDVACVKRLDALLERCQWFLHTLYLQQERNQERHAWEGAMLHEIRSELNPLLQRIDQAARMPQHAEKYLRSAHRQVEELHLLADNFMEISGQAHAYLSAVIDTPGAAVEKFLADYRDTTDKMRQTITCTPMTEDIWHTPLQGKAEIFSRVVRNLLHNAMKYGGAGAEIWIDADEQMYKDGYYWHLKISNPGQMSPEEERLKFTPRAHPSDRPEGYRDGAHVGLAASKLCASVYQAHLTLYNETHSGRVVAELWWPLAQQPANGE